MNENKIDLENKPAWLELPDEEIDPQEVMLWTTLGTNLDGGKPVTERWYSVYYSAEQAEAHSCILSNEWRWDGEPAYCVNMAELMRKARRTLRLGIRIKAYHDGKWINVREFPAGVPLDAGKEK